MALLIVGAATLPFSAEERINSELNARIRDEGMNRSQVMRTLHFLTDVYGPRADRLAQPEGGRRMGGQDDGRLGHEERPSRAVGLRPSGWTNDLRGAPSPRR